MCLVTELCIGSLEVYIGSDKKRDAAVEAGMPHFTHELLIKWMRDTASGMAFMHERGVVHRDIKVGGWVRRRLQRGSRVVLLSIYVSMIQLAYV